MFWRDIKHIKKSIETINHEMGDLTQTLDKVSKKVNNFAGDIDWMKKLWWRLLVPLLLGTFLAVLGVAFKVFFAPSP